MKSPGGKLKHLCEVPPLDLLDQPLGLFGPLGTGPREAEEGLLRGGDHRVGKQEAVDVRESEGLLVGIEEGAEGRGRWGRGGGGRGVEGEVAEERGEGGRGGEGPGEVGDVLEEA